MNVGVRGRLDPLSSELGINVKNPQFGLNTSPVNIHIHLNNVRNHCYVTVEDSVEIEHFIACHPSRLVRTVGRLHVLVDAANNLSRTRNVSSPIGRMGSPYRVAVPVDVSLKKLFDVVTNGVAIGRTLIT